MLPTLDPTKILLEKDVEKKMAACMSQPSPLFPYTDIMDCPIYTNNCSISRISLFARGKIVDNADITMKKIRLIASLAVAWLGLGPIPIALADDGKAHNYVPSGFTHTYVWEVLGPTDLEWMPNGDVLVAQKTGKLWVVSGVQNGDVGDPGSVTATEALDLSDVMCSNGERAIGSVVLHPNFGETNRFIYVYYTYNKNGSCAEDANKGPVNRLSRFVLRTNNKVDRSTERVLFDTPALFKDHHNSGDSFFGKDGNIWITVGDGGFDKAFPNPRDPDTFIPNDNGYLLGKIVRLTDDGGIPKDNPFNTKGNVRCHKTGKVPESSPLSTKCMEVFASGLRNPFRFAEDPNFPGPGVRFFINDVGAATWEEISEGGTDYPGVDYGWPIYEGPCLHKESTGCFPRPKGVKDPEHWDRHGPFGGAVTGGAFVPDEAGWPSDYDGTYMYSDYVFGQIYNLESGGNGCRSCDPPTSDYIKTEFTTPEFRDKVVSMRFGPFGGDGAPQALYYVTRGYGEQDIDGIFRIAYAGDANRDPVVVVETDKTSGPAPLTVTFDATGSFDPDGDKLYYRWDFDGDGDRDSKKVVKTYTYNKEGTYYAKLTVRDPSDAKSVFRVRIDVGKNPPIPVITSPPEGTEFAVGELFTLSGRATDSDGNKLRESALEWEVRQHHAEHFHPFLDITPGNDIPLQAAPSPEDFFASTNSYLEVRLTATDSDGLRTTVSRDIMPKIVELEFDTSPPGLKILLDGEEVSTPLTVVSWEDHPLQVEAPSPQNGLKFSKWSTGKKRAHIFDVPTRSPDSSIVASFEGFSGSLRFFPTDDAVLKKGNRNPSPRTDLLFVDSDNEFFSFLRFEVSGIGKGDIRSATLRLYCVEKIAEHGGSFSAELDLDWDEDDLSWKDAPAGDIDLGSLGEVMPDRWYEVDATAAVSGDGSVTFRLAPKSPDRALYCPRECADASKMPELVVELK